MNVFIFNSAIFFREKGPRNILLYFKKSKGAEDCRRAFSEIESYKHLIWLN